MKCTIKGCSAWSEVEATRERGDHLIIRERLCANGHRFRTKELPEIKPVRLQQRNRQIVKAVLAGSSLSDVARQFGLADHSEASRIVQAAVPGFDARGQGQRTRWAKKRLSAPIRPAAGHPCDEPA